MSGLFNSRWAPGNGGKQQYPASQNSPRHGLSNNHNPDGNSSIRPATITPQDGRLLPPTEELARFMKIVARLRWKLPFLAEGYRLATLEISDVISAQDIAHAEIMFKIDFHEYYALLERAIVHLLAVFNISVTSSPRGPPRNGNGIGRPVGIHRYHANVLEALREQSTPLSPVLGGGTVYLQLQKAKELRNRWKTADLTTEEREKQGERKDIVTLASFDFEGIISDIFGGLEESYARAREHVDKCIRPDEITGDEAGSEADWGFMVDAMDWEAV
ncbi:uncharacterized protein N7479_001376 [Penicillium vulpinum]|uniref:Uncharacterized protein n=1 Tax=Penicillium vulpinum TaxID=29845 RepID=A0A1V6RU22_9EURO|nr:uncharacterized protein N7479_001376 [Penicillium vulpinum]KAJ5971458.1 hypothetical protein N7479_001376 [Penicillium vulpinum]OQE05267.1 hypothetical protein PENVUL_c026G02114 [Penicillium vulpinum]